MSPRNKAASLAESQYHVIDSTNLCGDLDDRVEHRLHVSRRAADDAEHLGGCRLMLEGFTQFRVAFLDLFEQPHVLNGDYCLIRESFEQRDLFFSERTDLQSANMDHTDRNALT